MNFLAILVSALVPMVIGFTWYNPKIMGSIWMKEAGLTEEKLKTGNFVVIVGVSFFLSFLMAFSIQFMVIHQYHFGSMLFKQPFEDPNTEIGAMYKTIMDQFGTSYRTFKHGSFHGVLSGLFFVMPLIAINSLFERKSFKYIAIHSAYWIICMAIMGGILSAWI